MAKEITVVPKEEFDIIYRDLCGKCLGEAFSDEKTASLMYGIYSSLAEASRHFNLTAITDAPGVAEKHIVDSVLPMKMLADEKILQSGAKIIDIGAGAGFPTLPLAAAGTTGALPSVSVTAVDSTAKKVRYITDTAAALGIPGVCALVGRAEELAHGELRESADIVTARAVAALPVLVELCAPLVMVGGVFAALKANCDGEVEAAAAGAEKLGLGAAVVTEYALPSGDRRTLVVYRKQRPTPAEYPRIFSKISAKPL